MMSTISSMSTVSGKISADRSDGRSNHNAKPRKMKYIDLTGIHGILVESTVDNLKKSHENFRLKSAAYHDELFNAHFILGVKVGSAKIPKDISIEISKVMSSYYKAMCDAKDAYLNAKVFHEELTLYH